MKRTDLLALTTAALLATGSAFAGPECKNCPKKDASEDTTIQVVEREGEARPDNGEKPERRERPEGERKRPERGEHSPLRGLDLSEEQQAQAKDIMEAAREKVHTIMKEAKAKKEAGEDVDRHAIELQVMEIRKGAMKNVYDNVLNDEQRATFDERRKKMEEHRKEREGKEGERPERPRKDKEGDRPERPRKDKGDEGLDL